MTMMSTVVHGNYRRLDNLLRRHEIDNNKYMYEMYGRQKSAAERQTSIYSTRLHKATINHNTVQWLFVGHVLTHKI